MILKERIIGLCTKLKEKTPKVIVDSVDYILDEIKLILNENLIKNLEDGNYNDFKKTTSKINLSEKSIKNLVISAIEKELKELNFNNVDSLVKYFEISEEDYKEAQNKIYRLKRTSLMKDIIDIKFQIKNERDLSEKKILEKELASYKKLLVGCERIINNGYILSKKINEK